MGMLINPYTAPAGGGSDPTFSSNVLLCHCDGTNGSSTFVNEVYPARGNTITSNGPVLTTTAPLFGTASAAMGTNGIKSDSCADYNFGTGDFSIEFCMSTFSPSQSFGAIFDMRTSGNGVVAPCLFINGGAFYLETDGSTWSLAGVGTVLNSIKQAIGIFRVSARTYFAVEGTMLGDFADTHNYGTLSMVFGAAWDQSSAAFQNAKMDEFRVKNGVGLYTANYAVDTAPFPDS